MHSSVKEITVIDYIWGAILEVVSTVAGSFAFNEDDVMRQIIADNR